MKLVVFAFLVTLLVCCCSKQSYRNMSWNPDIPVRQAMRWMSISKRAGKTWGINPYLVTAIIAVESGGNPTLISKSNAVGLMQIKASAAGKDVYRYMGWSGQPSVDDLKNPECNISVGTAYLSILERGVLKKIEDPEVMQYALIASYVNGAEKLLNSFSSNHEEAIKEINEMDKDEFFEFITKNHPSPQASRYILKVRKAINAM